MRNLLVAGVDPPVRMRNPTVAFFGATIGARCVVDLLESCAGASEAYNDE
jgi:hypothetical protein